MTSRLAVANLSRQQQHQLCVSLSLFLSAQNYAPLLTLPVTKWASKIVTYSGHNVLVLSAFGSPANACL
jgi:hypothetical protein